jgi:hypothetical protein
MDKQKTSSHPSAQEEWPLENHPMLSEHWLDDLDEAIEEFERCVEEGNRLLGLPPLEPL